MNWERDGTSNGATTILTLTQGAPETGYVTSALSRYSPHNFLVSAFEWLFASGEAMLRTAPERKIVAEEIFLAQQNAEEQVLDEVGPGKIRKVTSVDGYKYEMTEVSFDQAGLGKFYACCLQLYCFWLVLLALLVLKEARFLGTRNRDEESWASFVSRLRIHPAVVLIWWVAVLQGCASFLEMLYFDELEAYGGRASL